jgi:isopenicillin-N N-acyltransferase like protein
MLRLTGDARSRGRAQALAEPGRVEDVRAAVRLRLDRAAAAGHLGARARGFLEVQQRLTAILVPEAMREVEGIAEGFGLSEADLFAYLHLGTLADLAETADATDGCSAWAVAAGPEGPLVVKNRDFRGEHVGLQRVMLHADPAWRGREVLCIGSLGSPGAYSSGMNSDGLALVDTQVATTDHAPGVLRYFLMTHLLARCATVAEALDLVRGLPHAGGGTLVMADAAGGIAAVELGASVQAVERGGSCVARTNHFTSPELAATTIEEPDAPVVGGSQGRLAELRARIPGRDWTAHDALALMAGHDDAGGFCRHGQDGDSRTISNVVFACSARMLRFTEGFPCTGTSEAIALGQ